MISTLSIGGFGAYAPPTVVTNADLAKRVDTSDEWIVSRTGISERRVAEPSLGVPAQQFHRADRRGRSAAQAVV